MAEGITKADFARTMGVDPAQVTRWSQSGMPTLPSGRVDPAPAAEWVRLNVQDYARRVRSIGAAQIRAGHIRQQQDNFDEGVRLALRLLSQRIPGDVARLAIEAGAAPEAAFALYRILLRRAPELANETLQDWMGLPTGEAGPMPTISHDLAAPDWNALAARAGKRPNLPRWEAFAVTRFGDDLPAMPQPMGAEEAAGA